jgi:hypothetical protein
VAADVHFEILSDRGREILDELQERTGHFPYVDSHSERRYYLDGEPADVSGFDAMPDRIAPDWREYLSR